MKDDLGNITSYEELNEFCRSFKEICGFTILVMGTSNNIGLLIENLNRLINLLREYEFIGAEDEL